MRLAAHAMHWRYLAWHALNDTAEGGRILTVTFTILSCCKKKIKLSAWMRAIYRAAGSSNGTTDTSTQTCSSSLPSNHRTAVAALLTILVDQLNSQTLYAFINRPGLF
jgi:hypothetical protein